MVDDRSNLSEAAEALQEADAAVADAVEPLQESKAVRTLGFLSEIGDQPQIRALSASLIIAGAVARNGRLARAGFRMLAAHELATALKNAVKNRVDRTRPRSREETSDAHKIRPGANREKEETSFPSGHSAGATAAGRAFAREFPEHKAAAHLAAGGVALAQIPRSAHYPTDVGAGIAIGIVAELAVDRSWRLLAAAVERD
jgi:undecaprenyl-diphosphatase